MEFGIIHDIDLDKSIFTIRYKRGLRYFFIPKGIFKKLKKYLYAGNYVSFYLNDTTIIKENKELQVVKYFKEISVPSNARRTILYSKKDNTKGLVKFLDDMNNLMFIDLEMSMADYDSRGHQIELIQAAYIITDHMFNELCKRDFHIKPTILKTLNKRTCDFLHITNEELDCVGIEYNMFYEVFKKDLEMYNPTLVIFGKNDKSYLQSSYKINNVDNLNPKLRFVNIAQLLKTYYEMPNDPGLFRMYEELYDKEARKQKHDAYEDAYYTMMVYKKFKEIIKESN